MIKGKSVEGTPIPLLFALVFAHFLTLVVLCLPVSATELRVTFHLKNEFTPEEEKKVREENEWCDERQ